MHLYLPIANLSVNALVIILLGGVVALAEDASHRQPQALAMLENE